MKEQEYTVNLLIQTIYDNAQTLLRQPANLNKLIEEIKKWIGIPLGRKG